MKKTKDLIIKYRILVSKFLYNWKYWPFKKAVEPNPWDDLHLYIMAYKGEIRHKTYSYAFPNNYKEYQIPFNDFNVFINKDEVKYSLKGASGARDTQHIITKYMPKTPEDYDIIMRLKLAMAKELQELEAKEAAELKIKNEESRHLQTLFGGKRV